MASRELERASSEWFDPEVFSVTGKFAIRVDVFKRLTGLDQKVTKLVLRQYSMRKESQGKKRSDGPPTLYLLSEHDWCGMPASEQIQLVF